MSHVPSFADTGYTTERGKRIVTPAIDMVLVAAGASL
jgi:hypothetical protein